MEIRNTVAEAVRIGRLNEPDHREPENLLRGLGLLRDGVLLRAAVVLFGNAERLEFEMPQCLLRVARFRGIDRTEFLDNRQFNGNAFALLSNAERFLRDTLPIAGRFEPGRLQRIDEPLYPPLATREALANALCHRDDTMGGGSVGLAVYDDRLEVTSTGSLHFGLTPEDLFDRHESRPWNPQDGGTGHFRWPAAPRDRGRRRLRDGALPAWPVRAGTAERERCGRSAENDPRSVGSGGRRTVAARNSCATASGHHHTPGETDADRVEGPRAGRLHRAWTCCAVEAVARSAGVIRLTGVRSGSDEGPIRGRLEKRKVRHLLMAGPVECLG